MRELAFTGRVVDAEEAARIGLITSVVDDPLVSATAIAHDIAGKSPDAIRAIKQLIGETWHPGSTAMLGREAELEISVMAGDNQREAAAANLEKRAPRFRDPKP